MEGNNQTRKSVSDKELGQAFALLPDPVLILNQESNVLFANAAATLAFNIEGELEGKCASELFNSESSYKFDLAMDRVKRFGKSSKLSLIPKRANLGQHRYLYQAIRLNDQVQSPILVVGAKKKTNQKMEERLKAAMLDAQSGELAKRQFLANVSHEVRTPMNMILGYANILRDEQLSEREKAIFASGIVQNGKGLLKIIDRMIDLSNLQNNQFTINETKFPLFPFLKKAIDRLKIRYKQDCPEVELSYDLSLTAKIKTDKNRLWQILSSLVENAVKFSESSQIKIEVTHTDGKNLSIKLKDSGIGIPKEYWERVFEPFTQYDGSLNRLYGGLGLGLATTRQIARALSGDIKLIESNDDGSTFEILLPCNRDILGENSKQSRSLKPAALTSTANILLVEDMEENRVLVQHYLKSLKCKLDVAQDGVEALERVSKKSYDLILMDLQMPKLDGYCATSILRKKGLKTPIVALTAHNLKEDVEKCMSIGFNGHISKPFKSKDLLSAAARYCI